MAFVVCRGNGVRSKSRAYLSGFISSDARVDAVDVYRVVRVESVLGLADRSRLSAVIQ